TLPSQCQSGSPAAPRRPDEREVERSHAPASPARQRATQPETGSQRAEPLDEKLQPARFASTVPDPERVGVGLAALSAGAMLKVLSRAHEQPEVSWCTVQEITGQTGPTAFVALTIAFCRLRCRGKAG